MSFNKRVKDEDILNGFASLHQAMATGFDQVRTEIKCDIARLESEIHNVRNDVSRLEQRMLRRFDDVDGRLALHELRISALEARP